MAWPEGWNAEEVKLMMGNVTKRYSTDDGAILLQPYEARVYRKQPVRV